MSFVLRLARLVLRYPSLRLTSAQPRYRGLVQMNIPRGTQQRKGARQISCRSHKRKCRKYRTNHYEAGMFTGTKGRSADAASPANGPRRGEEGGTLEVPRGRRGGGCSAAWRSGDSWLSRRTMGACGGPS